jgi:hypothetical protein
MALGTDHVTLVEASAASRTRSNSAFIRELWSDEIIASYKNNLVMAPLVVEMNHTGKKGDTIHIPNPQRGAASAKIAETQVTLQAIQELQKQYLIDEHWEYSRLIEDIVDIQADDSLRAFYTDDAGFALAKKTDSDLHLLGAELAACGATPTVPGVAYGEAIEGDGTAWDGITTGSAITDIGFRDAIQCLDDNDVPHMNRVLVIPPVEKNNLTGIPRFTEESFVGERGMSNTIRNGYIGNLYGVEVYVSTNCAVNPGSVAGTRAALLFSKEAMLHIAQLRPRTQTQYKQEYLGDLFTADMIYGTGVLRPESGTAIIVPA